MNKVSTNVSGQSSRVTLRRGFTLVELMVSIAIFALMTALVVYKYSSSNQGILLTNLAYDTAIAIRTTQTYGLSVKGSDGANPKYTYAYGVVLGTQSGTCAGSTSYGPQQIIVFSDSNINSNPSIILCDNGDTAVSSYAIKRGAYISGVCATSNSSCTPSTGAVLTISFKRPDPRAVICLGNTCSNYSYAKIALSSPEGSTRNVVVRSNGQITVED